MLALIIIILVIVAVGLVKDAAYETKTLHRMDKIADQNWEKLKEHYREEGLDIK